MSTSDPTSVLDDRIAGNAVCQKRWGVVATQGATERKQKRIRRTVQPGLQFNIAFEQLTTEEAAELDAFIDAHEGGFKPFLFRWFKLYRAIDEVFGAESGTEHQLILNRDSGALAYDLEVLRPIEGTVTIEKWDGAAWSVLTEESDYDIDYRSGAVTLAAALQAGEQVRWRGEFRFLVRFVGDPALEAVKAEMGAIPDLVLEAVFA